METASLIIKVDSTGAKAATADLDKLTDGGKRAERAADDLARQWKVGGAIIGGVAAGALTLIVRNTIRAEKQLAQLDAILKSTGNAAGYSRDQLVDMANEMSRSSTFASGDVMEAQTRLLSYSGIMGENIPRAMQAVIDQSARLGISVTQSAETIGRALESPSKAAAALAQQGFGAAFTDEVRKTIEALEKQGREADAQRMILGILEESYAGAARAARDTFGGAVTALKNTLGDLTTGADGSLDGATQGVNDLIEALTDPGVQEGFGYIVTGATQALTALAQFAATSASVAKWVGEELAARVHGAAAGDIVRLEDEAERIKKQLRTAEKLGPAGSDATDFMRSNLGLPTTDELRKRLGDIYTMIDSYRANPLAGIQAPQLPGASPAIASADIDTRITKIKKVKEELEDWQVHEEIVAERVSELFLERQRRQYEAEDAAVEAAARQKQATDDLVDAMEFELSLIGLSNTEREKAIALRLANADVASAEGQKITDLVERMQKARDARGLTDEMTDSARGLFATIVTDSDRASAALDRFFDNLKARMAERLFDGLMAGFGGMGGGGGWAGFASAFAGAFTGGGRAAGGPVMAGQSYLVGEHGPEMFAPGQSGRVHPIGPALGGGGARVKVEVINNGPPVQAEAQTSTAPDGTALVRMVINTVADDMAGGGRTAQAMQGRFGLRPAV